MGRYYLSEEELQKLRILDKTGDYNDLLEYVESIWKYADKGYRDNVKDGIRYIELHTFGWSGNEDIIEVLKDTDFWSLYRRKDECGGHYYFKLPHLIAL